MRFSLLFLCATLALPLHAANVLEITQPSDAAPKKVLKWEPGKNDGLIAPTTATMLEQFHYLHLPFDAALSSKMLDLYLNTLDPQHLHFLQSDLAEFEPYRATLGELTKEKHDTSPAYVIFNRFIQRLQERTAYAKGLLHDENLDFNGNERISLNRKNAPYPKDMDDAKKLWRERLRFEYLEEKLNQESPKELAGLLAGRRTPMDLALAGPDLRRNVVKFVETRYTRILRNVEEFDNDQVLEKYLTSLAGVYDPHSDYEDRDSLEQFTITMSLSLFGIGAVLSSDDDGYCKIMSLQPGMPADKSKQLKPGDRIVSVAQGSKEPMDVVQMPLKKVVDMIRGPKGTEVRLTVIPADAVDPSTRVTVSIIRDEIKLEDQQAKAKLIEVPGKDGTNRLGIIDLPSFYASFSMIGSPNRGEAKSATLDVNRLLLKLEEEHVDGIILDLRHNPGGSLTEAIDLTGLFVKEGPVVQVGSADGSVQVMDDRGDSVQYDGPLMVLTSPFSASASEIVAGALQDYGRAVVVGGTTHGKGSVQSLLPLAQYLYLSGDRSHGMDASLGAVKYTTNKFYRVTGSSTQLKGVTPDITLPSTYAYMETEESADEYAMKWDEIGTAKFDKLNRVQPYLPELQKRSNQRVAASKDFGYVREDIEVVKKAMAEKSISLNELQRLKETEEADARKKARDAELKSRKDPEYKIYDLTLKHGDVEMKEELKPVNNPIVVLETGGKPVNMPGASGSKKAYPLSNQVEVVTLTNASGEVISHTNQTAVITPVEPPSPEEKAPLDEAERILMDYISLLHSGPPLTAEHQSATATP